MESKQLFRIVARGDEDAVNFLNDMIDALHFYDDLIDRDQQLSNDNIHDSFWKLLITIPRNKFYTNNFDLLNPILVNAICNWKCANKFEEGDDEYELGIAYILRSSYVDILTMTALITGGREWADECAPQIRKHTHKETLDGYKINLEKEKKARAV